MKIIGNKLFLFIIMNALHIQISIYSNLRLLKDHKKAHRIVVCYNLDKLWQELIKSLGDDKYSGTKGWITCPIK